ncbi:hypothetical protein SISSUDRAFT_1067631 [Sistotremastrum suecicum HHB10207 ss-3]|uniref:Uncharacterized protein n=1 Tax=Sistotremastrum suecicum HHB10207 ss-3 TaxID=1314776 RepID=A0A165WX06_9AGAM|nr:hypothetical protein SISSUDRAFT_1067631 [Sistotremastrum suecicum HHB10207 ss-3]
MVKAKRPKVDKDGNSRADIVQWWSELGTAERKKAAESCRKETEETQDGAFLQTWRVDPPCDGCTKRKAICLSVGAHMGCVECAKQRVSCVRTEPPRTVFFARTKKDEKKGGTSASVVGEDEEDEDEDEEEGPGPGPASPKKTAEAGAGVKAAGRAMTASVVIPKRTEPVSKVAERAFGIKPPGSGAPKEAEAGTGGSGPGAKGKGKAKSASVVPSEYEAGGSRLSSSRVERTEEPSEDGNAKGRSGKEDDEITEEELRKDLAKTWFTTANVQAITKDVSRTVEKSLTRYRKEIMRLRDELKIRTEERDRFREVQLEFEDKFWNAQATQKIAEGKLELWRMVGEKFGFVPGGAGSGAGESAGSGTETLKEDAEVSDEPDRKDVWALAIACLMVLNKVLNASGRMVKSASGVEASFGSLEEALANLEVGPGEEAIDRVRGGISGVMARSREVETPVTRAIRERTRPLVRRIEGSEFGPAGYIEVVERILGSDERMQGLVEDLGKWLDGWVEPEIPEVPEPGEGEEEEADDVGKGKGKESEKRKRLSGESSGGAPENKKAKST